MNIILGSTSPRRKELLAAMGFEFRTMSPDIDESFSDEIPVEKVAAFLAEAKANALVDSLEKDDLLICSDTVVIIDNQILGKPTDRQNSHEILSQLSGNTHLVITGVALKSLHKTKIFSVKTEVKFGNLSDKQIEYYIQNYNPFDKAGSYGIQDWIGLIGVEKINGSYTNVMGLPTHELYVAIFNF
ncbi:MAG: septum formation protein Maf [Flavobacteriales bacterium]|jgi:septum formation protein|nr:septum formation protein Maf [Crocinitomicaceae bacterium]NBX79594.1 septum formation protein Maf [Flavobacteriales bacterium]NCA22460.1 septum formation protein Maf [Crocinitomicaceae bacterium]